MAMEIKVLDPSECSDLELNEFELLVSGGGEVDNRGLRWRILNADKLIFIIDGNCVAVGAIKNPETPYKNNVFIKAGLGEANSYRLELGWLYVSEKDRGKGYAKAIMATIIKNLNGQSSFATTRADNKAMHHLFETFGYKNMGNPYKSEHGDHFLVLYTKS